MNIICWNFRSQQHYFHTNDCILRNVLISLSLYCVGFNNNTFVESSFIDICMVLTVSLFEFQERIIATCLENRIAVYSPHTSFDAISGGVNDWLASGFGMF